MMMDAANRILVKENGRLYRENRNLSNQNLKLTEKFGAFARTLENLLIEFKSELSTNEIPKILQIKEEYTLNGAETPNQLEDEPDAAVVEGTKLFNDLRNILYSDDTEDTEDLQDIERFDHNGDHDVRMAAEDKGGTEDRKVKFEIRTVSNDIFESESDDNCESGNGADSLKTVDKVHEHHSRNDNEQNYSTYDCTKCYFFASSIENLEYHRQNVHFEDLIKCPTRNEACSSEPDLNLLTQNFLSHDAALKKRKSCNRKPEGIGKKDDAVIKEGSSDDNLKHSQTSSQYKCDKCSFFGMSFRSLMAHKRLTHNPRKYKCKLCHYSAVSKKLLKKHISREHMVQSLSKLAMKGKSYDTSKQISRKSLLVKCEKCELITKEKYIRQHMSRVHSNIRFPCTLCNIEYKEMYTLKKHMKKVHKLLHTNSNVEQRESSAVQSGTSGTVHTSPYSAVQQDIPPPKQQGGSTVQNSVSSTVPKCDITVHCGDNVLYRW